MKHFICEFWVSDSNMPMMSIHIENICSAASSYAEKYRISMEDETKNTAPRPRGDLRRFKETNDKLYEIICQTEENAYEILENMGAIIIDYEHVDVCDLDFMIGRTPMYKDSTIGWKNLEDAHVDKVDDGYALVLPKPIAV